MAFLFFVFLWAPVGAQPSGELLYRAYCVGCHGDSGRGDGPVAARLKEDFGVGAADLTMMRTPAERVRKAISDGGRAVHRSRYMPAWGRTLSGEQVEKLAVYVESLRTKTQDEGPPSLTPAYRSLTFGRQLYMAHCLACHGPDGSGGGPFLMERRIHNIGSKSYLSRVTDEKLDKFVESGIRHSGLKVDGYNPPLDKEEREQLIFYLRSLQFED